MSTRDIPVETLRDLLEQARSFEDRPFTVERTFTLRITGNVVPDGADVTVVDDVHVSVSSDAGDDLSAYIEEAVHEAISDDPYVCSEVEAALTKATCDLETLLMDLADAESEHGVDAGFLAEQLEDKTGIPLQ
jgi:hypothetical protein